MFVRNRQRPSWASPVAAISSTIGAAFAGQLAFTTTSGPGFVLKQEALGLGIMAELPMVVVDIQRAGPSTGMPTKIEQADLMLALYGRNSESPVPVIAPYSPGDCFVTMIEAATIAVRYMTPVVVLSDGFVDQDDLRVTLNGRPRLRYD